MMAIGINLDGRAAVQPSAIAALGAKVVRVVAYPDANITSWLHGCRAHGLKTMLVLARESIGSDPNHWAYNIAMFRGRYGGLIDYWQIGNEADSVGDSSWTMTHADLSHLLRVARFQLGQDAYLIGAGMSSGDPDWAHGVDWGPVNALAVHPYARWPDTPDLDWLIQSYADLGKPLWVTEYNARTVGMAAALRDDPRLIGALAFCYSNSMVPDFGLIEDGAALADFKAAAARQSPADDGPCFVLGFETFHNAEPALIGEPLENERGGVPDFSQQLTSNGMLTAANIIGRGWTLLFWERPTSARYLFAGGRAERIA
jgi:hypothetical protein